MVLTPRIHSSIASPATLWVSGKFLLRIVFLAAIVMGAIFAQPLFQGAVYTEDDLIAYYLPTRAFYHDQLAAGESFAWLPNLGMGVYLHGEGENGMYHPVHWLLYRFLPLHWAFNLDLLLPYPFLLLGMYLLSRRLSIEPFAALFGAMTLTFCGFFMTHYVHMNLVAVAAHIPWLLLCIHIALRTGKSKRAVQAATAVALLTASQFLNGFPQAMYWSLLAEGAFALCLFSRSRELSRYLLLIAAKALAVLLGAIQWLPTKDVLDRSYRAAISPEVSLSDSIHPINALQFVSPYLFHQRTYGPVSWDAVYIGSATLALVVWVLMRARRSTAKPLIIALVALAVVSFAFALGRYGHVYGWKAYLPVIQGFRSPARLIVLTHIAISLAAAMGFAELYRSVRDGERRSWTGLLPLAFLPATSWLIVAGVWVLRGIPDSAAGEFVAAEIASLRSAAVGAVVVTSAAGLVALGARGKSWALAALVVFGSVDMGLYGLRHKDRMEIDKLLDAIEMPPQTEAYRVTSYYQPNFGINTPIMKGVNTRDGYYVFKPDWHLDYGQRDALRVASVGWSKERYGDWPEAASQPDRGERWVKIDDPMPRARLVAEAKVSENIAGDLAAIDIARTALVFAPVELGGGDAGKAEIVEARPGFFRVRTEADSRQLLVISESYHDGWIAREGDRTMEVFPVYGDIMGCVLESGGHEVTLKFEPESLRRGKLLTLAGAALTILFLAQSLRGAKNSGKRSGRWTMAWRKTKSEAQHPP